MAALNLSAVDLGLLIAYLAGSLLLGIWLGRGQRTATDYMLGGRDLPGWTVLLSIVATETSTVTFLSVPGIAAFGTGDLTFLQLPLGYLLGRVIVSAWLLPKYFAGEFFTAYQVLHLRFGSRVKQAAASLFLITRTLADGLRLYLTAVVLKELSGLPMNESIALMGAITIVYTFFGGMKAVVWTDVMQFFVYVAGAGAALWILLGKVDGGFAHVVDAGSAAGKWRWLDLSTDLAKPYTLLGGLLGGTVLALGTHGTDQLMVQRYLCAQNERAARRALVASGVVVLAQFAFFLLIGVALFVFYGQHAPATPITTGDQVFRGFIFNHLQEPRGLLGLVLGAVFAAAMSTLSSSLNSSATTLISDLYVPLLRKDATPEQQLRMTRAATLVFGGLQVAVGILGQKLQQSVVDSVLTIAGLTTGAVLGVFALGSFGTRATARGALVGLVAGIGTVVCVWALGGVAWPYFALIGALTTYGVGSLVSRL